MLYRYLKLLPLQVRRKERKKLHIGSFHRWEILIGSKQFANLIFYCRDSRSNQRRRISACIKAGHTLRQNQPPNPKLLFQKFQRALNIIRHFFPLGKSNFNRLLIMDTTI